MNHSAKLLTNRHSQKSNGVILSQKPMTWDGFFAALKGADIPDDFLDVTERGQEPQDRNPFDDWRAERRGGAGHE